MGFWQKKHPEFEEVDKLIHQQPGVRQADLARLLGVSRSTIQRRLPSMDEAGYHYWEDEKGRLWPMDENRK